jgi:hypothetical protein
VGTGGEGTFPLRLITGRSATHSLMIAGLFLLVLSLIMRPLVVPALAWQLHIVMDSFSHGDGRWQTLMFYPVSDWHINGVNWWQHPGLMMLYWGALPILWVLITFWRQRKLQVPNRE